MEKNPFVAIFVLNWNGKTVVDDCLRSLQNITYNPYSVTFIDNGSTDDSIRHVREHFPDIEVLSLPENIGFTGASNYAFDYFLSTRPHYVCFVSNDVVVDPGFLEPLVETARSSEAIGLINPKIYYAETDRMLWYDGGYFNPLLGRGIHWRFRAHDKEQAARKPRQTDIITGCVYLARSDIFIKVGGLDNRFFNYAEDTDWSLRVAKAGYKCMYEPRSIVWHKESHDIRKNRGTAYQTYYLTRNVLLLMYLHGSKKQRFYFIVFFFIRNVLASSIYYALRGEFKRVEAIIKALVDYRNRRFGKQAISFHENTRN